MPHTKDVQKEAIQPVELSLKMEFTYALKYWKQCIKTARN